MSVMRTACVATFLVLLGVSAARAASFVEGFDSGTLPPQLVPHAGPGYAEMVATGKLNFGKADGTGAGEVFVRTAFVIGQDFTVSVVANRTDLSGGAKLGLRVAFQGGSTAEIYLDGPDGIEGVIKGQSATQMVAGATATLQVRRTGNDIFCEYDIGGGFLVAQSRLADIQLGKVNARPDMVLVQSGGNTAAESGNLDDFTVNAGHIQGAGGPTPTPTVIAVTPTPRPSPATLDHFFSYVVKPTKGAAAFVPLGPVTLTDFTAPANYDVAAPSALALPADKNGGGTHDAVTHLLEYKIKRSKGAPKFTPGLVTHVLNQCSDLFLALKKPVSLLVPTAKDLQNPVAPPANPQVDHFICYKAKPQTVGAVVGKIPKGTQVDVIDQFHAQARRYDLKAVTKFCTPADKSGNPVFLKGGAKGTPAPITPATVLHADSSLVCYQAKLAKVAIPQIGCGPLDPKAKGTKIDPAQSKFAPTTGIFVNNQLGPRQLNAVKELELCVPTIAEHVM
jgi:hypothetical protein